MKPQPQFGPSWMWVQPHQVKKIISQWIHDQGIDPEECAGFDVTPDGHVTFRMYVMEGGHGIFRDNEPVTYERTITPTSLPRELLNIPHIAH